MPWKVQPVLPKWKVPDHGQSQRENHSHSKTRLHDYHDSAANMINSTFYFYRVIASGPMATSKQNTLSFCDPIHENNIICCALLIRKTEKVCIFQPQVKFCCGYLSIWTAVYLALSIYNTGFVALAVGTITWSSRNSCYASGCRLGSQHCCFSSANRGDYFYGKRFDVSYITFLISFENQTQVYHLG